MRFTVPRLWAFTGTKVARAQRFRRFHPSRWKYHAILATLVPVGSNLPLDEGLFAATCRRIGCIVCGAMELVTSSRLRAGAHAVVDMSSVTQRVRAR